MVFVGLKPYSQRRGHEHSAQAVLERLRGPFFGITGAVVIPVLPPAVQGLGNFGGFQYLLQDQAGHSLEELARATQDLGPQGNSTPALAALFSSFPANDPRLVVTLH